MKKTASINLRVPRGTKKVEITSDDKPQIQEKLLAKWQNLIDTAARIVDVPSGLIMRLNEETIEVLVKSDTEGNPYKQGEQAELIYGLYCETVIGTQEKLIVPNARISEIWKHDNPDVDMDMISYLGYPINWPDGEVFGTVCLLDKEENQYDEVYQDLLVQVKQHIEEDLKAMVLANTLYEKNQELEEANLKKAKFLSIISHDLRGNLGVIDEFLKLTLSDFDQVDKATLKKMLGSLQQNTSKSRETLNDLINWSKQDVVGLTPVLAEHDLNQIIEDVLSFFNQNIDLKGIQVKKHYDLSVSKVKIDRNMFSTILRNLTSNAIKYNQHNGELRIDLKRVQDAFLLTIADSGVGMDDQQLKKLFHYNPDHKRGTKGEESAGIGLMLVREFIEKLKLKLSVSSERGVGTAVTLEIPVG